MPPAPVEPDIQSEPEAGRSPEKQIHPSAAATTDARMDAAMDTPQDAVLVVDFGAQYAQLIARRVRECHVYSEIVPWSMPVEQMLAKRPKAIILSGGPKSVYSPGAPGIDASLFSAGVPTFGICYGHQVMASALGGTVARTGQAEYGSTRLRVADPG